MIYFHVRKYINYYDKKLKIKEKSINIYEITLINQQ